MPNGLSYRESPSETTSDDSEIQARQHEKEVVAKKQAFQLDYHHSVVISYVDSDKQIT